LNSALQIKDLSLTIGGARILNEINLQIKPNEILGIIGPNGAGKTSLFNLISGIRKSTKGQIFLGSSDITDLEPFERARLGIARTFQTSSVIFKSNLPRKCSHSGASS